MIADQFIAAGALLDRVWNTAPFLKERLPAGRREASPLERAESADGFLEILAAAGDDDLSAYFALCLAAHHATVATYVPTDVDSKIRGLLWRETKDVATLRVMFQIGQAMHQWSLEGCSRRVIVCGEHGRVSGHDGEWLSVMAAAHGRFLATGDHDYAARSYAAIDSELKREARAFVDLCLLPGRELDVLRVAASVIHNVGDINQSIGSWDEAWREGESARQFGRLAQENLHGYGGIFGSPAELYRELLASEGHRHYPLRGVKSLRKSADLLLPLGPFLDDYGATLATSAELDRAERSDALDALVRGCKKVPGQAGYYRAIAGFREASSRAFDEAASRLPLSSQRLLKEADLRRKIAVPRRSFESSYVKRVERLRREHGAAMRAIVDRLG